MFEVKVFNEDNFAEALSSAITPVQVIKKKDHFLYLCKYLGGRSGLKAKTMVIEDDYISRDYLHDYAGYYSLCFEGYKKVCKRIHFFTKKFTASQFSNILLSKISDNANKFWESYLGYVVVKPIPFTVIGSTVLKTYPHDASFEGRNYWGLRDYTVHVFGVKRTIRSLVFQEQDKITAACATTAIWSTLSKVFTDFQVSVKSPSEITSDADEMSEDGSRLFPNNGLNVLQICQAIESAGLVCEVKHNKSENNRDIFTKNDYLKELVRAYSSIGIPIILVMQMPSGQFHAITLLGHRHRGPATDPSRDHIVFMSDNIDRLYAHDDQWGPFARIKFQENDQLITPWNELRETSGLIRATDVIVSVFPKIRISYEDIRHLTLALHGIFKKILEEKANSGWSWDIRLDYSENYKSEIKDVSLSAGEKMEILTQPMPKFIWIVSCYGGTDRIADFVFDATGVRTGMIGLRVIIFIGALNNPLHAFIKNNEAVVNEHFDHPSGPLYRDWLLREVKTTGA